MFDTRFKSQLPLTTSLPPNIRRHPGAAPIRDGARSRHFEAGIREFNAGRHWHAHEEWEHLWLGLEGDDKLFVQGLIMAAAMLHQYGRKVARGVVNHHANVLARLPRHAPRKWGVDVAALLADLERYAGPVRAGGAMDLDPAAVQIVRVKSET